MEEITTIKPKGKRGRPPKDGSAPKTRKTEDSLLDDGLKVTTSIRNVIEDPILEPYKIYASDIQYVVVDSKRPEGAIMDNVHGYFTSIGAALVKVAKLKMNKDKKFTLPEYVGDLNKLIKDFKTLMSV